MDGVSIEELKPGEFLKDGVVWFARTPNGLLANLEKHLVIEHTDDTITVRPSILVTDGDARWHGHLVAGEWREI